MQYEFELNSMLRNEERASNERIEGMKEAGKDKREKVKQTSKKFESSGNDVLEGGIRLNDFNPQIGT